MNIQIKQKILLLIIITLLIGALISCSGGRQETAKIISNRYFLFDPKLILTNLSLGKEGGFVSVSNEPDLSSLPTQEPVNWGQADYFGIAGELHNLVWGESLETWKLYRMEFTAGCKEIGIGFQYAQFVFFKEVTIDDRKTRVEHFIEIDPSRNFAQAMETDYYPVLETWKDIDLEKVIISAGEALEIAEKDGGHKKRSAVNDVCSVSVGISRDTVVYDGWLVIYSPSIFIAKIDPASGN